MSILRSRAARGAFAAATLTMVARAEATVTQVDGTTLAVATRMQTAIDACELPCGTIDAVKDVADQPQILRPRPTSPMGFLAMRELAGFENRFGWYNVGDAVSTAAGPTANLHLVISAGGDGSLGAGLAMLGLLLARRRPQRTGARMLQVAAVVAMLGALLGGCEIDTADIAIDGDAGNESDVPVLQVNESSAYLVWRNVAISANNGSDVAFSRSSDGVRHGAHRA